MSLLATGDRRGGNRHKMTRSAPCRSAISPSVCCVHPGRVLELSTAIGVSRMRTLMEYGYYQQFSPDDYTVPPVRHRLKSGRLQPLRLHNDPQLTSQACLGVVTVDTRRKHHSLTAPVHRTTSLWAGDQRGRQQQMAGRRTHSAAPSSKVFQDVDMLTVCVLNSDTTQQVSPERTATTAQADDQVVLGGVKLPPVALPASSTEHAVRVDFTRREKAQEHEVTLPGIPVESDTHLHAEATTTTTIQRDSNRPSSSANIINPSSVHTRTHSPIPAAGNQPTNNMTPKPSKEHVIKRQRSRRPSGNRDAKLSKGWSTPTLIEPLQGRLVPVSASKKGNPSGHQHEAQDTISGVDIDINQIMQDSNSTTTTTICTISHQ